MGWVEPLDASFHRSALLAKINTLSSDAIALDSGRVAANQWPAGDDISRAKDDRRNIRFQ